MTWSYAELLAKAKVYVERAMAEDREGPLFPFWAALGLELMARATLARVHPALLADPTDGSNLMYAFGYPTTGRPKSIPAKTLFLRCQTVVPNFTKSEFDSCMSLVERRNEELHTGAPAFDDFPTSLWLADFFRVTALMLDAQKLKLTDLFSGDDAKAAEKMMAKAEKDEIGRVKKLVAAAVTVFEALSEAEKTTNVAAAKLANASRRPRLSKITNCPACKQETGLLVGELVSTSEPKAEEDAVTVDLAVLPTSLSCAVCGLKLTPHTSLAVVGLGGQFTKQESYEPSEYYQIEFDPADYYEPEYGND